jgi:serine/threonine protein kinase/tetratricopeptide (TPR) repeat protein
MTAESIPAEEKVLVRALFARTDMPTNCVYCSEPMVSPCESETCSSCGNSSADSRLVDDLREALGYTPTLGEAKSPFISSRTKSVTAGNLQRPLDDSVLGEFELINEIGRGGMGIVYRARQPSLGREVAIKVLHGPLAASGSRLTRFRTETRAVARLNHPNIVPIYAQGESDSIFYYAMGLIEGCSLDQAIHKHPELLSSTALRHAQPSSPQLGTSGSPPSTATTNAEVESDDDLPPLRTLEDFRHLAALFADVADGLAHAHDQGVVHRDIKPQNLLLGASGRIYISDFGLSRLLDEPRLTMTGELMGTPAYLSPEQVRGDESLIDHRTDIYSLGVALYELLTGRRPFRAKTRDQVVSAICTEEPVRPRRIERRIPCELETICLRAIAKEPGRRFATAHLLAEDLRRFAAGKPIQSKPPSWVARAAGGMRRHRGATGIGVMTILCLALGAGYAVNVSVANRDEGNRLLDEAYEQLVFFDYRTPELVGERVTRAESLGADPTRLNLVHALTSLGLSDNPDAISRLRSMVDSLPQSVRSRYLLAWALWRSHEPAESRAMFEKAAAAGEINEADEWFFRGLASHFDRPELAIEAYKKANELRASANLFFPQAILHLARAYNQQMYSTRNDEALEHAEAILKQLIQQGHYRAYPHYLLSITQRLAGDIRQSAEGATSPIAASRYRAALEWARLGQGTDANDDRPVTAEAECLERLGLFEEAIDARSRAIKVAGEKPSRCEAYHYRWRLNYWTGDFSAAQADIAAHAACMPQSVAYAHVYPSWVAAEAGDMPRAAEQARMIAHEAPDDAQAVLWSAACLRLLGLAGEAQSLLETSRQSVRLDANLLPPQSAEWIRTLYELSSGLRGLDEVLAVADRAAEPRKLRAEAFFHAAMAHLGNGDRDEAKILLDKAVNCFDSEVRYTYHARTLLTRMQMDAHWPGWLVEENR